MACGCKNNATEEIDEYALTNFCRRCGKKLEPEVRRDTPDHYDTRTGDAVYWWSKRCPDYNSADDSFNRHNIYYQERQEPGELPF